MFVCVCYVCVFLVCTWFISRGARLFIGRSLDSGSEIISQKIELFTHMTTYVMYGITSKINNGGFTKASELHCRRRGGGGGGRSHLKL